MFVNQKLLKEGLDKLNKSNITLYKNKINLERSILINFKGTHLRNNKHDKCNKLFIYFPSDVCFECLKKILIYIHDNTKHEDKIVIFF